MRFLIGLNKEQINSISFAFLNKVSELTKKDVVVYSDSYNAINTFSSELAEKYPLWIAEYNSETINSGNWNDWIGFQYSDNGKINGISSSSVDLDKFKEEIFLVSTEAIDTEPHLNSNLVTYTVKAGNTLSGIALKYDTTVESIVGLNNIKNPNLIFIGQVLDIDTTLSYKELSEDYYETSHIVYTIKYR